MTTIHSFGSMIRYFDGQGRSGTAAPLIIWYEGVLVGQITLGGITYGASRSAHIGYSATAIVVAARPNAFAATNATTAAAATARAIPLGHLHVNMHLARGNRAARLPGRIS